MIWLLIEAESKYDINVKFLKYLCCCHLLSACYVYLNQNKFFTKFLRFTIKTAKNVWYEDRNWDGKSVYYLSKVPWRLSASVFEISVFYFYKNIDELLSFWRGEFIAFQHTTQKQMAYHTMLQGFFSFILFKSYICRVLLKGVVMKSEMKSIQNWNFITPWNLWNEMEFQFGGPEWNSPLYNRNK